MNEEIKSYYDELAPNYDANRFGNSYGKFIDGQERAFLKKNLPEISASKILDLGCGTGRFLNFANFGVDISPKMIEIAQEKYPEKTLKIGTLSEIPFEHHYFDSIFCFHVIMHLDEKNLEAFLKETSQKLAKNGTLIFDFPSKKRRHFLNFKKNGWHGANDFSMEDLRSKLDSNWEIEKNEGILFFPIHRIPVYFRSVFKKLDSLICRSLLKEYSSYIIVKLRKNDI